MNLSIGVWLFSLIIWGFALNAANCERSNDEIYGAIRPLIYSFTQLDSKLERHENRERAFGELMKKAMQALQKGQKNLEPISGIFGRLDERVSQIETLLINQEGKYNEQSDKMTATLTTIFKFMEQNNECFRRPPGDAAPMAQVAAPAIDSAFMEQQNIINQQVMEQLKQLSNNVHKLLANSEKVAQRSELVAQSVPNTQAKLNKIEDRLEQYGARTPAPPVALNNAEFENTVLKKFGEINSNLNEFVFSKPETKPGLSAEDRQFIEKLNRDTVDAVESVKETAIISRDMIVSHNSQNIRNLQNELNSTLGVIMSEVKDSANTMKNCNKQTGSSYGKLNESLEVLNNFNNILMTNSEYVLDTQRKVEFGTLQVVQKISAALDELRGEFKLRFDGIEEAILSNQTETVSNLTSQIGTEIDLVWKQLNIMQDDLSDTKELLQLFNGRHEGFVNATFVSTEQMAGKVELIRNRMLDMDSNLNYLLGKLSLVAQEFDNIKMGVAQSLADLRNSMHSFSDKVAVARGPGPHNMPRNQYDGSPDKYETEVNLLQKRQADETQAENLTKN